MYTAVYRLYLSLFCVYWDVYQTYTAYFKLQHLYFNFWTYISIFSMYTSVYCCIQVYITVYSPFSGFPRLLLRFRDLYASFLFTAKMRMTRKTQRYARVESE
uniref:Putative ovule protein n=1 Tax=Solanum chacoense TaxID=4108 RepID=A0A0V0INT3_SOLCH